jgi:hypothetical protein
MHGGGGIDGKAAVRHESVLCSECVRDLQLKRTSKSIDALPAYSQVSRFRGTDKSQAKSDSPVTHKKFAQSRDGI